MAIDWYLNAERACKLAGHGKETQDSYMVHPDNEYLWFFAQRRHVKQHA